jgi:hypothetical protein
MHKAESRCNNTYSARDELLALMMAVPTTIHKPKKQVKNSKNNSNNEEVSFMLQMAVKQIAANIDLKGLMQVIAKTGHTDLALQMLAGVYKTPNIPKQVLLYIDNVQQVCTMERYDPWEDQVYYSYYKNKSKHIYVLKDTDTSIICSENYKDYEQSWSSGKDLKSFSVKLPEMETAYSSYSLSTWMAGENVAETGFTRNIENIYTEDIF